MHRLYKTKTTTMNQVNYMRVSHISQADNNSLAAQREDLERFAKMNGSTIVAEFTEVESGRKKSRPQLQQALKIAKKEKATLVVYRLDRLARDLSFLTSIMDSGVAFKALDIPEADRFTLQLFGALAERESDIISKRVKRGMAKAKAEGKTFGANAKVLAAQNKAAADEYAKRIASTLVSIIENSRKLTYRRLADRLNSLGLTGRNGKQFYPASARNLVKRLNLSI